jgi:hypothetical protein
MTKLILLSRVHSPRRQVPLGNTVGYTLFYHLRAYSCSLVIRIAHCEVETVTENLSWSHM